MEFYANIRAVHICAASLSGALFFVRALCSILGAHWPHQRSFRILSAAIDTVLLVAAISLWVILPKEIFANNWLTVKLVLVFFYIAAGFVAMRQANPKKKRIAAFGAATLFFGAIVLIARAHSPMGLLFWQC